MRNMKLLICAAGLCSVGVFVSTAMTQETAKDPFDLREVLPTVVDGAIGGRNIAPPASSSPGGEVPGYLTTPHGGAICPVRRFTRRFG